MNPEKPQGRTLQNITYATIFTVLIGWLLVIGQSLLLPIILALIFVYIVAAFDKFLGRVPLLRHLPTWLRKISLYLVFIALVAGLATLISSTVQQLIFQAPLYQENLTKLFGELTSALPIERLPDWETARAAIVKRIDIQAWLSATASQLSSAGGMFFLILIYVFFLAGERAGFATKLREAFPNPEQAERTQNIITAINESVGQYLGAKTLINIIVGIVSYLVMLPFGLDYAAFWALLIGLLNYIPYIGSIIAVLLPTLLSLVQFGSWTQTLILFIALQVVQLITGNVLEPKMLGRKVNLSPFVVLVALSFWSAIWGIAGAILAVPLTSILTIIFKEIPATRPLAILMSDDTEPVLRSFNRPKILRRRRKLMTVEVDPPAEKTAD
ncbi:AI-2E family transporter [Schaalia sp. Marseille-Q2122]|uniref:AI-2E family transporter n=1 Tax=Schaalia sp. Marseille-Q2122 TaxID=2736604 RepID=UPI00158EC003|nr:AI-2E family transporter [Schaalia sp. Marseille-Q2122]